MYERRLSNFRNSGWLRANKYRFLKVFADKESWDGVKLRA